MWEFAGRPLYLLVVPLAVVIGVLLARPAAATPPVVPVAAVFGLLVLLARASLGSRGVETRRWLMRWTVIAFCAHFAVALIVTVFSNLWLYLGPDALYYHDEASAVADHWARLGPPVDLAAGKEGFSLMLGGLYAVFGKHPTVGLAVNCALGAALVLIVTDTTTRLFGPAAGRFTPAVVAFFPAFLIWPSELLREAGVLFFLALTANFGVRLAKATTPGALFGLALSLSGLAMFRGYVAFGVAPAVLLGIVLSRRDALSGVAVAAVGIVVLAISVRGVGLGQKGYDFAAGQNLQVANGVRTALSDGATSGFGEGEDLSTPAGLVSYLPEGLTTVLLGPFPWQLRSPKHLPAGVDALVMWTMVPLTVRAIRRARVAPGLRRTAPLLVPAFATAVIVTMIISNFGTVVRARPQVLILLAPLWALGLSDAAAARRLAGLPSRGLARLVALPYLSAPATAPSATR